MTASKKSKAKKLKQLQTARDRRRCGTAAEQKRRRRKNARTCFSCRSFVVSAVTHPVVSTWYCKHKKQRLTNPFEACDKHRLKKFVFKKRKTRADVETSGRAGRAERKKQKPVPVETSGRAARASTRVGLEKKKLTFWQRFFKWARDED